MCTHYYRQGTGNIETDDVYEERCYDTVCVQHVREEGSQEHTHTHTLSEKGY